MEILQLIMTHKEAKETVIRHLPIWENISKNIIFTSPEDSKMEIEPFSYKEVLIGKAEHHGEISAQRIINIFEYALSKEWEYLLLMEYDSFALNIPEEIFPKPEGVSAAVYVQNKPIKFRGKFYLHYPMFFTREGAKKTLSKLFVVKTNDRNFSDRFIGRAVEHAKIPVNNLLAKRLAYSKNTIEERHYPLLRSAVRQGAVFFHGVKNIQTLSQIFEIPKTNPIK